MMQSARAAAVVATAARTRAAPTLAALEHLGGRLQQCLLAWPRRGLAARASTSSAAAASGGSKMPTFAARRSFVDRIRVTARAGDGGQGCVSFVRTKAKGFRGPPDGGRGGKGGDVVLVASGNVTDLSSLRQALTAGKGGNGGSRMLTGSGGDSIVARVPPGTLVYEWDAAAGEIAGVLADLSKSGQDFVAARGGAGGRGNPSYFTHGNRSPTDAELGEAGEVAELLLELKTVADVGLVGFPNAGKSSLLRALTAGHATPEAAPYPFTTMWPALGSLRFDDGSELSVADIPGLVEGAAEGRGLGHAFLRHVERAPMLVYVVDMSTDDAEAGLRGAGDVAAPDNGNNGGVESAGGDVNVGEGTAGTTFEMTASADIQAGGVDGGSEGAAEPGVCGAAGEVELGTTGEEFEWESDPDSNSDDDTDWESAPLIELDGDEWDSPSGEHAGMEGIMSGPLFKPVGEPVSPWRAVELLDDELEQYKPGLAGLARAVVANKMDQPGSVERLKELRRRMRARGIPVFPVSALEGWGAAELIDGLAKLQHRSASGGGVR